MINLIVIELSKRLSKMTKQNIRLKEFDHNVNKIHIPSDSYLRGAPQLDKNRAYFMSTDENGFISTGNSFIQDFTIAIVGDSFVENVFVDEISRFESILERKFLSNGLRVKVINAGVSGMTGLSAFNLILNKLIKIKPTIVIFVQPSIDFSALLFKNGYFNDSKLFANLVPPKEIEKPVFETIFENKHQIYCNLVLLSTLCELNKIDLIVATCASDSSKRQLYMMNSILREERQNLKYKLLDLDKIFEKGNANFYDRQHLNKNGSEKLAEVLFTFIIENFELGTKKHKNLLLKEYPIQIAKNFNRQFSQFQLTGGGENALVESWLSITTSPLIPDNKNEVKEILLHIESKHEKINFPFSINVPLNKTLQQTLDLSRCYPGTYSLSVINFDQLPVSINDCRVYSIVNNIE